jgi:hypothetical protein
LGKIEVWDYGIGEYAACIKFGGLLFTQEGSTGYLSTPTMGLDSRFL